MKTINFVYLSSTTGQVKVYVNNKEQCIFMSFAKGFDHYLFLNYLNLDYTLTFRTV